MSESIKKIFADGFAELKDQCYAYDTFYKLYHIDEDDAKTLLTRLQKEVLGVVQDLEGCFDACCNAYELVEDERNKAEEKVEGLEKQLAEWKKSWKETEGNRVCLESELDEAEAKKKGYYDKMKEFGDCLEKIKNHLEEMKQKHSPHLQVRLHTIIDEVLGLLSEKEKGKQ